MAWNPPEDLEQDGVAWDPPEELVGELGHAETEEDVAERPPGRQET